ncbi:MAG: DUF2461 domain-containing protein [Clostridia bacterium]|nr:DUF2461 domain-containing protein [Clostridia bacterium]
MSEYKYNGITPETLMLLSENRFRNSREFYEEHKKQIKEGITIPMQQVICALADTIGEIDDEIPIVPTKMVSRVRRDTRFTKDKSLYRENLWAMFMRDKRALPYFPCMWFEVAQNGYSGGIGTYYAPPRFMELYREEIAARPDDFYDAVILAERAGAVFGGDFYKKTKPGCPMAVLEPYYNVKSIFFSFYFPNLNELGDSAFIEKIRPIYASFKPFYSFLLDVAMKYSAEQVK